MLDAEGVIAPPGRPFFCVSENFYLGFFDGAILGGESGQWQLLIGPAAEMFEDVPPFLVATGIDPQLAAHVDGEF